MRLIRLWWNRRTDNSIAALPDGRVPDTVDFRTQ